MDQVLTKYYKDLVILLPLDDVHFRSSLQTAGLFEGNLKEEVKAKPTSAEKNEHFLDCKIKRNQESFAKLLTVMEEFDSDPVKNIAKKIRTDIQRHHSKSDIKINLIDAISITSLHIM